MVMVMVMVDGGWWRWWRWCKIDIEKKKLPLKYSPHLEPSLKFKCFELSPVFCTFVLYKQQKSQNLDQPQNFFLIESIATKWDVNPHYSLRQKKQLSKIVFLRLGAKIIICWHRERLFEWICLEKANNWKCFLKILSFSFLPYLNEIEIGIGFSLNILR